MATRLFLCLFLLHAITFCLATKSYTNKYDNVDLEEILASERLLNGYVSCLLEKGPCTPDGKELKKNLPNAIQEDCKKCTDKQRDGSDKVMHYIIDNRPNDWIELEKKYNSDGSYKVKYMDTKKKTDENEIKTKSSDNE